MSTTTAESIAARIAPTVVKASTGEVVSPTPAPVDALAALTAKLAALEAENARLKAAKVKGSPRPSFKVSAKGAVSVYGLGRWPVTLYASQWETLLGLADQIRAFIANPPSPLAVKGAEAAVTEAPPTQE